MALIKSAWHFMIRPKRSHLITECG